MSEIECDNCDRFMDSKKMGYCDGDLNEKYWILKCDNCNIEVIPECEGCHPFHIGDEIIKNTLTWDNYAESIGFCSACLHKEITNSLYNLSKPLTSFPMEIKPFEEDNMPKDFGV